jgi:hypothetical protein
MMRGKCERVVGFLRLDKERFGAERLLRAGDDMGATSNAFEETTSERQVGWVNSWVRNKIRAPKKIALSVALRFSEKVGTWGRRATGDSAGFWRD